MLQVQYNQGPNEETEIINTQIQKAREACLVCQSMECPTQTVTKTKKNICFENYAFKRALSLHGNMFENRLQYILTPL